MFSQVQLLTKSHMIDLQIKHKTLEKLAKIHINLRLQYEEVI